MKTYRLEIDGLRAISVLAVLFYHSQIVISDIKLFNYGFLGVDIFFVISGYLISNILFEENKNHNFIKVILNFYVRRIRRIIPLLFFIIFISLLLGKFILTSSDYIDLENSSIFTILFASNFYFYKIENDYFAQSSLLLPLLHTWSLAVEEQFYIIFPLIFLFLKKLKLNYDLLIITLLFLFSLLAYILIKDINENLSFYLFLTRFWEILAGVLIFYIEPFIKNKLNKKVNQIILIFCLFSIFYILLFFESRILIVLFSSLLILFYTKNNPTYYILENKVFTYLGKISFSIYLWHFVIFAFSRYLNYFDEFKFILILLIFLLSIISYKIIEKPFRSKFIIPNINFKFYLVSLVLIIITFINLDNKIIEKEVTKIKEYQYFVDERAAFFNANKISFKNYLNSKKKKFLIIGNSHGGDLYNGIMSNYDQISDNIFYLVDMINIECAISLMKHEITKCPSNVNLNGSTVSIIKLLDIFNLSNGFIISTQFNDIKTTPDSYFHLDDKELKSKLKNRKLLILDHNLTYTVFGERQLTYYDIVFDKNNKNFKSDLVNFSGDIKSATSRLKFNKLFFERRVFREYNKEIKAIAKKNDFYFISKEEFICDKNKKICYGILENGDPTYFDASHYTLSGAKFFGNRLINHNIFKQILNN